MCERSFFLGLLASCAIPTAVNYPGRLADPEFPREFFGGAQETSGCILTLDGRYRAWMKAEKRLLVFAGERTEPLERQKHASSVNTNTSLCTWKSFTPDHHPITTNYNHSTFQTLGQAGHPAAPGDHAELRHSLPFGRLAALIHYHTCLVYTVISLQLRIGDSPEFSKHCRDQPILHHG